MPLENTNFQIARFRDREVFDLLSKTYKQVEQEANSQAFNLLIGGTLNYANDGDRNAIDAILAEDTVATSEITFQSPTSVSVSVRRELNNNNLIGWKDTVKIVPGQEANSLLVIRFIRHARENFRAIEEKTTVEFLTEAQRKDHEARELALQKHEDMTGRFIEKLETYGLAITQKLHDDYAKKNAHLEEQYAKKRDALDAEQATHLERIRQEEEALAARKKEIDDRDNMIARRQIYKDIMVKFKAHGEGFKLTKNTQGLRLPIYISVILLLLALAGGLGYFTWAFVNAGDALNNPIMLSWLVGRQVILSVAFFVTIWFLIRWQNSWFKQHAEEEFKLKRLELDTDRACMIWEMAMEWQKNEKAEFPEALVERLSRNLFGTEAGEDQHHTNVDALASAMLQAASGTKFKMGDAELTYNRSDIKKLGKKAAE